MSRVVLCLTGGLPLAKNMVVSKTTQVKGLQLINDVYHWTS
jgi:hypothetical protein